AGTTRDVLEVHLDINGYAVTLFDTAGLRPEQLSDMHAQDKIEAEGIKRALKIATEADFKILLFDGTEYDLHPQTLALKDDRSIIVVNKCDVPPSSLREAQATRQSSYGDYIEISANTGAGLDTLIDHVSRETSALLEEAQNTPSLTRARHREALEEAMDHISRALSGFSPDMIAEDIRMTVRAIGRITGRTDVEDLLDIIFRDFCIGK
ncbi:MAG: tRNA uridine-5-carboxymethylaminomethyl(34) synthesis GTPase MnmE, partial [Alphaproteobacteria bacterium]